MAPTKIRREGREAFESGYTREQCPYTSFNATDWYEGYDKAQEEALKDYQKIDQELLEWESRAIGCPFHTDGTCMNIKECTKDNCAPSYWGQICP